MCTVHCLIHEFVCVCMCVSGTDVSARQLAASFKVAKKINPTNTCNTNQLQWGRGTEPCRGGGVPLSQIKGGVLHAAHGDGLHPQPLPHYTPNPPRALHLWGLAVSLSNDTGRISQAVTPNSTGITAWLMGRGAVFHAEAVFPDTLPISLANHFVNVSRNICT